MSAPALKPVTREAIPRALEKAERYRLINEPIEAESICTDVLLTDAGNQKALVILLLSLTDQFADGGPTTPGRARELLPRLESEYERTYYTGIIAEREAKAHLKRGALGSGSFVYQGLVDAMSWFEKAEAIRPAGNDDALLRWNTCVRLLQAQPQPAVEQNPEPMLLE